MNGYLMILCAFFCAMSFSQEKDHIDVQYRLQIKSDSFFHEQVYDSAYFYAKANFDKSENDSNDTLKLSTIFQLLKITDYINQEEQNEYFNKALQEAISMGHIEKLIALHFARGDNLFEQQDFVRAIPYFLKIDSLSKGYDLKNATTIEALLRRAEISKLSFTYETTNMAHSLLYEALVIAKEIKAVESEHLAYVQLADINQMIREFDDARKYIDLALPYFKEQGNNVKVARTLLMKSAYYLGVDSLKRAEETYLDIIAYLSEEDLILERAKAFYYYGNFLRDDTKNYAKAIDQLEIAKSLFQEAQKDNIELYHRCIRDLAFCNHKLGNYKAASEYYQAAYDLKIDLLEKFNRRTSKTMEAKYQTEKKEQEIALISTQKELTEQLSKSQRNILLGGLGLTSLAGFFLFILFRNRTKTNAKLRELDAFKTNFFANISHEFRTPLTLISSPIEKTLKESTLPPEKRSHFEMASRNTKRLLSLVDQLLDLSKIDSGALQLQLEKGNPTQLIAAWSESFSYLASQKNIEFSIKTTDKKKEGWFDRDTLEKIVVNLLGNAIKYTPENGKIRVNISKPNTHINFEVHNTGKGLTKQQMNTIFERFYQSDGFNDGVGIGLSLVKELTELHKGNIIVSQDNDQWTSFAVCLCADKNKFKDAKVISPRGDKDFTPSMALESVELIGAEDIDDNGSPILLVVEDNQDVRTLLFDSFKNSYQVIIAKNGEEGIKKALEQIPDIIVSDVMMPIKDGVALTKTLKKDERTSHIPIVLLTAKAGDENKLIGIDVGADDYITKPFNQKILKSKVNNLITLRKKLQSRYSQEVILKPKDIAITSVDEQFLEKVQQVLNEKLEEPSFTVADFSKAVSMSRMQLHRKLKALTGLSSSEFIRSQRLKVAAQILKKADINISEVGYSVGFNDHAYFSKCFREAYNCTPSEFINKG